MKWTKDKPNKPDCWFLTELDNTHAFPQMALWYLCWDFFAVDAHGTAVHISKLEADRFMVIERAKK